MSYVRGADRFQVQLLPQSVDEYVHDNAPVRFIEAFVDELDLKELKFVHAQPAATGRPPYDPADLLKLYLYGYLNRIRSSRRLEAECARNLEVMWLLKGLRPDFKTIADFRKDNRACFKPVFREFNLLCRKMDLFGAELVAIDGCKFKAVNNVRHHYTKEQLATLIKKIEERIDAYLKQLDEKDEETADAGGLPTKEQLQEKIIRLKDRSGGYSELLGALKESGQTEVSLIDADSRAMKKVRVGYNVQVAVDAKHHLIVEPEVVQSACDYKQLSPMGVAAKEALGVEKLQAVADAGYNEADQLEACEKAEIETFVADQKRRSGQTNTGQKVFPKEQFIYDKQSDRYRCPAGQTLSRGYEGKSSGKDIVRYHNSAACKVCALKSQCTTSVERRITRRKNEEVWERQKQRLKDRPEMMSRRREIVEHVFGTMRNWGHDTFLTRGLEKVRGEFSLTALTYNLRRVLSLFAVEALIGKMRTTTVTAA